MAKLNNVYDYSGRLELKDDKYEFVLVDENTEYSISDILDGVFLKDTRSLDWNIVYIAITIKGREALRCEGYLYQTPDDDNVVSYFLGGENVDKFLFEHTGTYMNIYIKTNAQLEGKVK